MKNVFIVVLLLGVMGALVLVSHERRVESGRERHPLRGPSVDRGRGNVGGGHDQAPSKDADEEEDQRASSGSENAKDAAAERVQKAAGQGEIQDQNESAPGTEAGGIRLGEAEQGLGGIVTASLKPTRERPELQAFGTVVDVQELIDFRLAFVTATAQLKKAESSLTLAQADFERQRLLRGANQNVSEKAFQSAQGVLLAEQANLVVAQAGVTAVEMNARRHWGDALAQECLRDTEEGQRLLQQDALLVQITLPAGSPTFQPPAEVAVQSSSGDRVEAKFVAAAPRTDPKFQGASFYYLVPAQRGGRFVPGISAVATVPAGEAEPAVVVPRSAVVWLHGKAWAYLEEGHGRFDRREVSTGWPKPEGWVQPPDFSEGHAVVVRGAQILLSRESQSQTQAGAAGDNE